MRNFLFLLYIVLFSLFSFKSLKAETVDGSYINDYANVITADQKLFLENLVRRYEARSGNEVSVVVVKSLEDSTMEDFAEVYFAKKGIGKKYQDNGVLLVVAVGEKTVRIEVGYGLEGVLTDIQSKSVIDRFIVPDFKTGQYYLGIENGVKGIITTIETSLGRQTVAQEFSNLSYFAQGKQVKKVVADKDCVAAANGVENHCSGLKKNKLPSSVAFMFLVFVTLIINFIFCLSAVDSARSKGKIAQNFVDKEAIFHLNKENNLVDQEDIGLILKKGSKGLEFLFSMVSVIFHYLLNLICGLFLIESRLSFLYSIILIVLVTKILRSLSIKSSFLVRIAPRYPIAVFLMPLFIRKKDYVDGKVGTGGGKSGGAGASGKW